MLTVSVVSHGHGVLLHGCLQDLAGFPEVSRVVLTLNVPEQGLEAPGSLKDKIVVIENQSPRGFGANHNAAFLYVETPYFCVLNPDVRCPANPFPKLIQASAGLEAAVITPATLAPNGTLEDNVRYFPRPSSLLIKALRGSDGRYHYGLSDRPFQADWVGGMFMLFRTEDFRRVGGFDEGFFLYYEDVDICARLWKAGRRVLACPEVQVIHDARRTSRGNLRYMRWHVASFVRYLGKHWLRLPNTDGL